MTNLSFQERHSDRSAGTARSGGTLCFVYAAQTLGCFDYAPKYGRFAQHDVLALRSCTRFVSRLGRR